MSTGRKGGGGPLGIETDGIARIAMRSSCRKGGGVPLGIETKKWPDDLEDKEQSQGRRRPVGD